MKHSRIALAGGSAALVVGLLAWTCLRAGTPAPASPPEPVITVALVHPQPTRVPLRVPATGSISAWQEASIGTESNGLRLNEVRVNVGDVVTRGQVLARFSPELLQAELAEANAAVALARAEADEAATNQQRARALDSAGVMSRQQVNQYQAVALTTQARFDAARAAAAKARLRVSQTEVLAPGDGVISARTATVGAVVPAGEELFRLIRDGRLEWRAVVSSNDLSQLRPGQRVRLTAAGAPAVEGRIRQLAPMIDITTRSGMAYVDLPSGAALLAGAFAQGQVEVGEVTALTLPQNAVVLRDGFHYVMQAGQGGLVHSRRVSLGQSMGDRVEVTAGVTATDAVIASGLGFLGDGDTVRVVRQ